MSKRGRKQDDDNDDDNARSVRARTRSAAKRQREDAEERNVRPRTSGVLDFDATASFSAAVRHPNILARLISESNSTNIALVNRQALETFEDNPVAMSQIIRPLLTTGWEVVPSIDGSHAEMRRYPGGALTAIWRWSRIDLSANGQPYAAITSPAKDVYDIFFVGARSFRVKWDGNYIGDVFKAIYRRGWAVQIPKPAGLIYYPAEPTRAPAGSTDEETENRRLEYLQTYAGFRERIVDPKQWMQVRREQDFGKRKWDGKQWREIRAWVFQYKRGNYFTAVEKTVGGGFDVFIGNTDKLYEAFTWSLAGRNFSAARGYVTQKDVDETQMSTNPAYSFRLLAAILPPPEMQANA